MRHSMDSELLELLARVKRFLGVEGTTETAANKEEGGGMAILLDESKGDSKTESEERKAENMNTKKDELVPSNSPKKKTKR